MTTTIVHSDAGELAALLASDRGGWRCGGAEPVSAPAAAWDEAVIAPKVAELLALSDDSRWDYLAAQGYSAADLDNVSAMMMTWLGPAAQAELRDLAEKDSAAVPSLLLAKWLDAGRIEALGRLAASYEFPSPLPALCYAMVDAFVTARVAVRVADLRRKRALRPPTNWTSGRPEDFEEDLRLAEAGYDEEVALWPEY